LQPIVSLEMIPFELVLHLSMRRKKNYSLWATVWYKLHDRGPLLLTLSTT